jgi:hypothetical protein
MALVLLSGRPGSGKTTFGRWLTQERGFIHVETDSEWSTWGPMLCVQDLQQALKTRNRARALGANVMVEWGFKVALLGSVRLLRTAGFDAWWFDGDEVAARQGYVRRRGGSAAVMAAYQLQVDEIGAARRELQHFYRDHLIESVSPGPTYMSPEDIEQIMLTERQPSADT